MTGGRMVDVTACQICGSADHRRLFDEPPFSVRECSGCSLVYVSPRLHEDDLRSEVYGETYWRSDRPREHGYADYQSDEHLYLKTFRRRSALVRQHCAQPGRVLDVGCAAGYFLRIMRDQGWDVYGAEPSQPIAQQAQSHLGAERVHVGTVDDLPARNEFAPRSFDLVTMWDVVEHVPDPQQLLRTAHGLLKPGGVLILETQNVASAFASLLGRRWHHYKHREHLYHFNPRTVDRLLQQAGFAVRHNSPAYGGKYVSLGFIAERAHRVNRFLAAVLSPLALVGKANLYLNLRDEMVVVATPSPAH